jgi:hypothetical protein
MLKNLAEFVELLQEKDRNQLQLTALAVILFIPNNYLTGIGIDEDFFDELQLYFLYNSKPQYIVSRYIVHNTYSIQKYKKVLFRSS